MYLPPNEKHKDAKSPFVGDEGFEVSMQKILDKEMYTYYVLSQQDRFNIQNAFRLGFQFCRMGFLSRGIK